jgi:Flp pilus assembly pilin Flp
MNYVKLPPLLLRIGAAVGGEEGETLFEFTMIVSLVAVVAVAVVSVLGLAIAGLFNPLPAAFGG